MRKVFKTILGICATLSLFSVNVFAGAPESLKGAGLNIVKINGELNAPGDTITYSVSDSTGKTIVDFYNDYEVTKAPKIPLSISDVKSTSEGHIFQVSVLDSCSDKDVPYSGKITFKNKSTNEFLTVPFEGSVKNEIRQISGDVKLSLLSGSKIYDFSTSTTSTKIIFGEDVEVRLSGKESGTKCLSYNLNPTNSIKAKYDLETWNSSFINFIGEPNFENKVNVTFRIALGAKNPKLYQLKKGTVNELEEVPNYKLQKSGNENVITFETMSLAKTYVMVADNIDGVEVGENVIVNPPKNENVETPKDPVSGQDDVPNPNTGSSMPLNTSAAITCIIGLIIARRMKKTN